MANNVIGVFDDTATADQVVSDLLAQGFNERNVSRFEGDQEDLANQLENMGVSDDEATYYVERLLGGGALVSVRANDDDVDEAVYIMNRYGGSDEADLAPDESADYVAGDVDTYSMNDATTETPVNAYPSSDVDGASLTSDADEARLAVAEEHLVVGKREVQRGGMRVRSVVTEMPVEEQVVLRDETIRVDRRPVDQAVTADAADLFIEQTFEFTETDEEAVVAKEAHVIEEVVVGKQVEERTETISDTVRRTDVEVDEVPASGNQEDYGTLMANDARFQGREWDDAEADIRTDWESRNEGSWDDNLDSVRSSWNRARDRN